MKTVDFAFQHAALRQAGARFEQTDNREIVFVSSLGGLNASMAIGKVAGSLGLPPDSHDARLLNLVEPTMKFRRVLRVGDQLPSELIDGKPSWDPKPERTGNAVRRLCLALGQEARIVDETATSDHVLTTAYDDLAMAVSNRGLVHQARLTSNDIVNVVNDLARIDWLCKAVISAQQCIGELAKLSQTKPTGRKNEFARSAALGFRDAVKWATEQAMRLDVLAADPLNIFRDIRRFQMRLWPALASLRAFALDSEIVIGRWDQLKLRPYLPGSHELEFLSRLVSVRYLPFDAQLFHLQPIPHSLLLAFSDANPNTRHQE